MPASEYELMRPNTHLARTHRITCPRSKGLSQSIDRFCNLGFNLLEQ